MTCELSFLPVGNADCIAIQHHGQSAVIVDLPKLPILRRWLQRQQIKQISRIYVTHAHRDHFASLKELVNFIHDWIDTGIIEFCLPAEIYIDAKKQVHQNPEKFSVLKDALLKLNQWERQKLITFLPMSRNSNPFQQGNLRIQALHPRILFVGDHIAKSSSKHNEISLVLHVKYGDFTALLLADLEGDGLRDLLEVTQDSSEELKAQVVKIPHHGGYPKNGEDLKQLLEKIDPEIAVLSVGSKNPYGHVVPELFKLLHNLKSDSATNLKTFICTEVTRTCAYSSMEIGTLKQNEALPKQRLCAGEITILAESSGKFQVETETEHSQEIANLPYASCVGRMEF